MPRPTPTQDTVRTQVNQIITLCVEFLSTPWDDAQIHCSKLNDIKFEASAAMSDTLYMIQLAEQEARIAAQENRTDRWEGAVVSGDTSRIQVSGTGGTVTGNFVDDATALDRLRHALRVTNPDPYDYPTAEFRGPQPRVDSGPWSVTNRLTGTPYIVPRSLRWELIASNGVDRSGASAGGGEPDDRDFELDEL